MGRAACDSNQLNAEGSRLKALAFRLSANLSAEPGSLEHHGAMPQCDSIQLEAEGSKLKAQGSLPLYTFSANVSGCSGLKISLQVITVTRFSVSDRLMMLCVQPGIM